MVTRKAANAATPVVTVTTDGSHWKLKQVTTFKTHEQEFDIGAEQEISTADGRKVKVSTSRSSRLASRMMRYGSSLCARLRMFR